MLLRADSISRFARKREPWSFKSYTPPDSA